MKCIVIILILTLPVFYVIFTIIFEKNEEHYNNLESKGFVKAQWIEKSEFNEPKCIAKINIRQGKNEYDVGTGRNTPILIKQDCNSEVWVLPKSETVVYYADGTESIWIRVATKYNDNYITGWVNRSFLSY